MADTPFTSFAFATASGSATRTAPSRFDDVINVKEFGAVGNGVADDTAAIQAAFTAAFGAWNGTPHGSTNKALNKPVFFPGGTYRTTGVLYLKGVSGGRIFGNAKESVTISFECPGTGNAIATSTSGADAICPAIMMAGVEYTLFDGFSINCNTSGTGNVGIFIYHDATTGGCTANVFGNVLISDCLTGILGGLGGDGGNCDNMLFINVSFARCPIAGLRPGHQNALNWISIGGGGINCGSGGTGSPTTAFGNCAALYSMPLVPMTIISPSMSDNTIDFCSAAGGPFVVQGGSSESPKCVVLAGTSAVLTALSYRYDVNAQHEGQPVFIDCTGGGMVTASGCIYNPGSDPITGTIAALDNSGIVIFDNLQVPPNGQTSRITGSAGSKAYLRGTSPSGAAATILTGFGGTTSQNI